jgi:MarR family transcriptional regulator, transcriptional regulator for hemolysin
MGLNRRIRDIALLLERALSTQLTPFDLTMSQVRILLALQEEGMLTQRQLAASVNTTESTVLVTLRVMTRRGLVARRQSSDDRRKFEVRITSKGGALLGQVRALMREILAIAFDGMRPAEVRTVLAAFDKIATNISRHYHIAP